MQSTNNIGLIDQLKMLDAKTTMEWSIYAQFITGAIGIDGLLKKLPEKHRIVTNILQIEMGVQLLELIVYLYLYNKFNLNTLARNRYYDWVITTPTMLFTVSLYFTYIDRLQKGTSEELTVRSFITEYKEPLIGIVLANLLMLVFGYLGETGAMNIMQANIFGFMAFGIAFYIIYTTFANKTEFTKKWFAVLITVWGLYGIAAFQDPVTKNNMFNGLDVVAKNIFGVYVVILIYKLKKEEEKEKNQLQNSN
jgi:bacteriorhodopsin